MPTVQIEVRSPNQLTVFQPPEHLYWTTILVLCILAGFAVFSQIKSRGWHRLPPILFVVLFGGVVFAVNFPALARSWRLDFSRSSNAVKSTEYWFGKPKLERTMRLDDAASAVVQVGFRGGKRLVLVTKSDKEFVPFNSDYTDVRGLDEARDAINQFLGAHPEN